MVSGGAGGPEGRRGHKTPFINSVCAEGACVSLAAQHFYFYIFLRKPTQIFFVSLCHVSLKIEYFPLTNPNEFWLFFFALRHFICTFKKKIL